MTGVEEGNFNNEEYIEEFNMSASNTVKVSKTKTIRLTDGKKSPRNLIYRRRKRPQLKNCVWSLSEAIKNATFWIRSEMYQENFKITLLKEE